jgi:putative NADH-flavin reductase
MKTLVVGASGVTGKLLVEQLLAAGRRVKIIARPTSYLPDHWNNNMQLVVIRKNITEITIEEMAEILSDCDSVASCLGHNLTWKGLFGKPRRLVTDTITSLCQAIAQNAHQKPIRLVLMNTAGSRNRDINEPVSIGQRMVISLLRLFLPPHADNEKAADYLRKEIGQSNECVEWVTVRPDNLINEEEVTEYTLHQSPTRSAIFNPGKTSRIHVAHFMATLILENKLWITWKGQMPVIYNRRENPLVTTAEK